MLRSSLVVYAIALTLVPAAAQQPSQAQRDAVRAACRSDFMANCAGVQPGGEEAFDCLVRNQPKLSSPCGSAVSAIASPASNSPASVPSAAAPVTAPNEGASGQGQSSTPATAPPPSTKVHPAAAPTKKIPPAAATTTKPAAPAGTATPAQSASGSPATPTVAPLGPIRPMLPRRALMILAQCRPDQQRLCAGVPAGGGQIFACLAANAQQLSPVCYDALARVSQ